MRAKTYRLIKLAKKFETGTSNIVQILAKHEFIIEDKPLAKVTEEMYQILVKELGDENSDNFIGELV